MRFWVRIRMGRSSSATALRARSLATCLVFAVFYCQSVGATAEPKTARTAAPPAPERSPTEASFYAARFEKRPSSAAMAAIGRAVFFDPSLSASGKMSCASCHDPRNAYGPPNDAPVQMGGRDLQRVGTRAVPSLRYAQNISPFSEHTFEEGKDESVDQGPSGGRTWDGRASSVHDQARLPLLSPVEMANRDMSDVVEKVRRSRHAGKIRDTFGDNVFDDLRLATTAVLLSLEVFQQSPADFYPYDSKYDAYLRGQLQLSAQEARGLELFENPRKGNCASCHPSRIVGGAFPQFTDFGFVALGVPRNRAIPANDDPKYFDLGLCGPLRVDLSDRAEYCGLFRAPTLRNVALRRSFFHNGRFHSLEDVLKFYVQRDTHPEVWYPRGAHGTVNKFDDLPAQYRGNINRDPPFDRKPGEPPALSDAEIRDVIAFLRTLTDGYERTR